MCVVGLQNVCRRVTNAKIDAAKQDYTKSIVNNHIDKGSKS